MPNGHDGTEEEWRRLEAPLRSIDPLLDAFAGRHGATLARNYHSVPERSLRWGTAPERLVQIYLQDADRLTWNVWLCASQDRGRRRFWKRQFLRYDVPMGELGPYLEELLEEAMGTVNSWRPEDLEFASTLAR